MYGPGIAGRRWWETFSARNKAFGMHTVTHDNCVFRIKVGEEVLIIAIVIDECLMIGNSEPLRQ